MVVLSSSFSSSLFSFVFSLAVSQESSNPRSGGKWGNDDENNDEEETEEEDEEDKEEEDKEEEDEEAKAKPSLDFTIILVDSAGLELTFPLSSFSPLQREIEVMLMKTDFITDEKQSEKVFQTFYFPFEKLLPNAPPEFDLTNIQEVIFHFDKSRKGVVMLDQVGLMKAL
jgi:hypothetical protein